MARARVVIAHPAWGVFLRAWLNEAYWSQVGSGRLSCATTFKTKKAARAMLPRFGDRRDTRLCEIVPVRSTSDMATIEDLKLAGLGEFLGYMEANAAMTFPRSAAA